MDNLAADVPGSPTTAALPEEVRRGLGVPPASTPSPSVTTPVLKGTPPTGGMTVVWREGEEPGHLVEMTQDRLEGPCLSGARVVGEMEGWASETPPRMDGCHINGGSSQGSGLLCSWSFWKVLKGLRSRAVVLNFNAPPPGVQMAAHTSRDAAPSFTGCTFRSSVAPSLLPSVQLPPIQTRRNRLAGLGRSSRKPASIFIPRFPRRLPGGPSLVCFSVGVKGWTFNPNKLISGEIASPPRRIMK